jgi:putative zinc finger/helix-turn-helix YgiT family protein
MQKQVHAEKTVTRKCYECGADMTGKIENYKYTECGLNSVNLANVLVFHCTNPNCGAVVPEIPAMSELHRGIVFSIIQKESLLSGSEIRFLRKTVGLTAVELAQLLGIHKTNLSRWENGARPISKKSDCAVRLLAIAAIMQDLMSHETPLVPKMAEAAKKLSEFNLKVILQRVQETLIGPKRVTIDPSQLAEFGQEEIPDVIGTVQ